MRVKPMIAFQWRAQVMAYPREEIPTCDDWRCRAEYWSPGVLETSAHFDRDHGLVSEGFEESDLLFVKGRTTVRAILMTADGILSRKQRGRQRCANAELDLSVIAGNSVFELRSDIVNVDSLPVITPRHLPLRWWLFRPNLDLPSASWPKRNSPKKLPSTRWMTALFAVA